MRVFAWPQAHCLSASGTSISTRRRGRCAGSGRRPVGRRRACPRTGVSPESISIGSVTGARFVGELLERELQLPRIDALGLLAKQALAQHVELMAQRRVLALRSW